MNAALGALVFVALLCGAGAGLARLLTARVQRISFGRAWLFGCAALSVVLHLPLAIDGRITQRSFALAAAACLAASVWFVVAWYRSRAAAERTGHWLGWIGDLPWLARIGVLAVIALAVSHSLRSELSGYDARTAFALKARILYDTGDVTGEDFCDLHRLNFNPTYPLLMPLVEAEMYWFQGGYQAPGLRLLFVSLVLAVASIYAAEIRRFASAGVAAWSALLLLLTPMLVECFEGAGLSGSADLPLCAFVFAGTLDLFRYCREPNWRRAAGAGLLFGAAVMTKQEGLVWVGAGGITVCGALLSRGIANYRTGRRLMTTFPAVPGKALFATVLFAAVLCVAAGLHVLAHRSMPKSPYYPSIAAALTDPQWLVQLGDRPQQVASYALVELLRTTRWGLFWPCILGSLVLLPRGPVPLEMKCWRAVVGIVAAIYLTTMVVSPLHLQYQLSTTFSRLTLHFFPLAMLVMAEQVVASGWMRELTAGSTPVAQPAAQHLRAAAVLLTAGPALAATLAIAA